MHPVLLLMVLVLSATLSGCGGPQVPTPPEGPVTFRLEKMAGGFDRPVFLVPVPDQEGVFLVAEQVGRISVLADARRPASFLDISDRVRANGEQGLLGLALDPSFPETGAFYVHYSDLRGDTVLSRFLADPGTLVADAGSEQLLLQEDQPYPNHNGGMLAFGPDGMLYMGLGDGGLAGDPDDNAQDPSTLLGSILRINVAGGNASSPSYRVPRDNPFIAGGGAQEVFIYGLRNPWRFSFDRATGDLWVADVGQDSVEEVTVLPVGEQAGANLGWPFYEGSQRFRSTGDPPEDVVMPQIEYPRSEGHCAITGGHVYRGTAIEALAGTYVFGDFCSGTVWTHKEGVTREVLDTKLNISSFGEDGDGEIYVLDHRGSVHRVVART